VETPKGPEPEVNNQQVQTGESDSEPVEMREEGGRSVVLDALNIHEEVNSLPSEDQADLKEVRDYVLDVAKSKGLAPTVSAFKRTLDGVKEEMGLDKEADPSIVISRIAGVVKAWKNISFVKDPAEKRQLFMRLARMGSVAEMNKYVFDKMSEYKVWQ
jgi:delta-aminolevulinic acid dehydratase/porphobilinogen synthase